ncbi:TRML2 protein, partial [Dasyornis broadbenti]|nr:TRML2 protein [Dasyornis broadbenti]
LQGQAPEAKRRREGGTLYIQCPYAARLEDSDTKYWCRMTDQRCQELVQTRYGYRQQSRDGKITIEDDTTAKTVSITMTELKAEQSGTYWCAYYSSGYFVPLRSISLNVFKGPKSLLFPSGPAGTCPALNANTFMILSLVLLTLLILALVTSVILGVKHYKLLGRTGRREAEDASDRPEGTAQPGSTGRRESSRDDSKDPAYINLDVQSPASPEDPLYCNVEPSQAHRNPQSVEYAVIAFNQPPRNDR